MKIKITLWLILIALYMAFHFGYRTAGSTQLYRINETVAFELHPETDVFNGVTIRGYSQTNPIIRFFCGACQADYSRVDMAHANYIKGDYVYSGYPQNEGPKTEIVNLRTGETLNVDVPDDASGMIDLQTLPEYRERGLVADEQFRLRADYVRANFPLLSTYTGRCLWINFAFMILAFLLTFPGVLLGILDAFASDDDNTFYYSDNS
ncbi:MAG: hypothetical protein WKF34_03005 [Pyrinomonadaceae bacterium]